MNDYILMYLISIFLLSQFILFVMWLKKIAHSIHAILCNTSDTVMSLNALAKGYEKRFDRIDHDHQQIKTRLADEEAEDQAEKRKAREGK
jgi:hypothetical protein